MMTNEKTEVTVVHALPTLFTWDAQRGRDEEMSLRKRASDGKWMLFLTLQASKKTLSHF